MTRQEYGENKAITQRLCGFNPIPPQYAVMLPPGTPRDDTPVRFDGEMTENGDVVFRFAAPEGHDLKVSFGMGNPAKQMFYASGNVYEYIMPEEELLTSRQTVTFTMDGVSVINPSMPVTGAGRVSNYYEFPDLEHDFVLLKDVPHGSMNLELYYSKSLEQWERCVVYTPPQYHEGNDSYPVLYLQGGAGCNEWCWFEDKVNLILDNLLAEGKCVPFIVVMNDSMIKMPYEKLVDDFDGMECILTKDCPEFIASKYRVLTGPENTALAGFSLGSMMTSYIGFAHPELFAWLGIFSGTLTRIDNHDSYEDSPYLAIMDDFDRFSTSYKLVYRSKGEKENRYPNFDRDDEYMAQRGLNKLPSFERQVIPNYGHESGNSRQTFYHFAQKLFKTK